MCVTSTSLPLSAPEILPQGSVTGQKGLCVRLKYAIFTFTKLVQALEQKLTFAKHRQIGKKRYARLAFSDSSPSRQPCHAQGANSPLFILLILVSDPLFPFLKSELGIYPKHFSGFSSSFLFPSCHAKNLS